MKRGINGSFLRIDFFYLPLGMDNLFRNETIKTYLIVLQPVSVRFDKGELEMLIGYSNYCA